MRIDLNHLWYLNRVAILHRDNPDVLSAFEVETLWEMAERHLQLGDDTLTTAAEWGVIMGAYDPLTAAHKIAA